MKTIIVPASKPQMSQPEVIKMLSAFNLTQYPVKLLGVRGYYKNTMGNPVKNDIGIYDDSIFIVSPDGFASFNANTDPSIRQKGVATLKPGNSYLYKIGLHGISGPNPYKALRQHGRVTVIREGQGEFTDTSKSPFYINIHKGSLTKTSSLGCQTIYPKQWEAFIHLVEDQMKRHNQMIIPYTLIEM